MSTLSQSSGSCYLLSKETWASVSGRVQTEYSVVMLREHESYLAIVWECSSFLSSLSISIITRTFSNVSPAEKKDQVRDILGDWHQRGSDETVSENESRTVFTPPCVPFDFRPNSRPCVTSTSTWKLWRVTTLVRSEGAILLEKVSSVNGWLKSCI